MTIHNDEQLERAQKELKHLQEQRKMLNQLNPGCLLAIGAFIFAAIILYIFDGDNNLVFFVIAGLLVAGVIAFLFLLWVKKQNQPLVEDLDEEIEALEKDIELYLQ